MTIDSAEKNNLAPRFSEVSISSTRNEVTSEMYVALFSL